MLPNPLPIYRGAQNPVAAMSLPPRPRYPYFVCLAAVACALAFQLFVPPIVGLSDNGDFQREIGFFGYGPAQRIPPVTWSYVAPTYIQQDDARRPGYEQWTSDYLFVVPAIGIGKFIPGDGTLPIVLIGALHAGGLLAALARLFWVTRFLRGHFVVWIGTAIILTDVGYAAYANSFFAEAASGIFGLWTIAEVIGNCEKGRLGLGFLAAATLLICAKAQNASLAVPLALYAIFMGRHGAVWMNMATVATVSIASLFMFASIGPRPKLETSYNMLFSAVLPESRDPRGDLRAFGLDPEFVQYKGTRAWSPGSGLYEANVRQAMQAAGPIQIAMFYVKRPARLWRHVTTLFPVATQIRPETCGNFELSAGQPPAARATRFSMWSTIHERVLGRVTKFLLFGLVAMTIAGAALCRKWNLAPAMALLPALGLTAFLTAAFGDANEPVKHQYLFNLMLDACLLFTICLVGKSYYRAKATASKIPR
jgi:hypothetical protein